MHKIRLFTACFFLSWSADVTAQSAEDTQRRLDDVRKTISGAEARQKALQDEATGARIAAEEIAKQLIAQGAALRQTEAAVDRLESRIDDLETSQAAKRAALDADRKTLVKLIASMERLQRRPAILSLLQPATAITTARSASVMASLLPTVNAQATKLRNDLGALASIEDTLLSERRTLDGRLDRLASEQAELNRLLALRRDQAEGATAQAARESARIDRLAGEAEDLEALLTKLLSRAPMPRPDRRAPIPRPKSRPSAASPAPSLSGGSFASAKGRLLYPVVSTSLIGFGDIDGNIQSQGERRRARPGAQVRAPFDGHIVFAGPFRGYGALLIIDHGEGYHSLLAGLGTLYADRGQSVLMGEPIGAVDSAPGGRGFYLELRHQGKAIDPAPWFIVQSAAAR